MAFIGVTSTDLLDEVPERNADDLLVSVGVSKLIPGKLYLILRDALVKELMETVAEDEATRP